MRELADVRSAMPDVVVEHQRRRMHRHGIRPAPLDLAGPADDRSDAERERLLRRDAVVHAIALSRTRRRRRAVRPA